MRSFFLVPFIQFWTVFFSPVIIIFFLYLFQVISVISIAFVVVSTVGMTLNTIPSIQVKNHFKNSLKMNLRIVNPWGRSWLYFVWTTPDCALYVQSWEQSNSQFYLGFSSVEELPSTPLSQKGGQSQRLFQHCHPGRIWIPLTLWAQQCFPWRDTKDF